MFAVNNLSLHCGFTSFDVSTPHCIINTRFHGPILAQQPLFLKKTNFHSDLSAVKISKFSWAVKRKMVISDPVSSGTPLWNFIFQLNTWWVYHIFHFSLFVTKFPASCNLAILTGFTMEGEDAPANRKEGFKGKWAKNKFPSIARQNQPAFKLGYMRGC